MEYFIDTETGEIGPLPMQKLNRMFRAGEIRGDQLCRAENSAEKKRLDVMFKHFAPPQDVVATARRNVAAYNSTEGASSMLIGAALIVLPTFQILRKDGNLLALIPWLIAGIGLIIRGYKQNIRGTEAMKKLNPPPIPPPIPPTTNEKPAPVAPPKQQPEKPASGGRLEY